VSTATLASGRYRLERELGRGGMATVHLARDAELDRPVAVKVLAGHLSGDDDVRERFVREARMAAGLSHPNVVQVFDAGEEEGKLFIVMEYVRGATLADELARAGKLSPAAAVDLALQACAGLEHAHEAGLVHRDVKPGNLLLREDGVLKITDFGIARAVEATQLTQVGSVLGTAAYLSPEQAAGEPVTAATDIYGLGVVLYELLTGRTPYVIESVADLVQAHRGSAVTPVQELEPDVPEALETAVMKCLARNPAYRPESAAALAHELAAASPESPTVPLPPASGVRATEVATLPLGRPAGRSSRTGTAGRSRWAAAVAAAVVLALAAVALGYWAAGRGDEPEPAPARQSEQPLVEPVPAADDPAVQARNISAWLRDNAG
jgi:eukaryotic-like serine/threonine-protein kinase